VIHEAMAWESHWTPQPQRRTPAGAGAIRLLADRHTRAIMLSLADEPQSTGELERRSPLSRSALRNRLRRLVLDGLLRARKDGCERRFELSEGSRRLASVALLAGRWEWQWERPAHNRPGSDLHSLLHILAPAVRVPEPIAGVFHLRLAVKGADDGNIYLAAQDGNIRTLTGAPSSRPQASAHGTPEAWCDLLLEDDGPITMTGDREQLCQIVRAMRVALTQELPEAGRVGPRLRKHLE
jgi:DNA-binding HxlR family transcriptional regulator